MVTSCCVALKVHFITVAVKLLLENHLSALFLFYCQDSIKVPHHQLLGDSSHLQPFLKLPTAVELRDVFYFG